MFNCQYLSDKNFKQKKETFPIKCYHFLGSNKSLTDHVIRPYYLYLCSYLYRRFIFEFKAAHIDIMYGPNIWTKDYYGWAFKF